MRDALSILERCLQDGDNEISEDKVKELVGIPKLSYIEEIVTSVLEKNIDDCKCIYVWISWNDYK